MGERALALDEQQLAAAPVALDDQPLGRPARKSATTASTAIPQPAIAIPVWPVGTKTERRPRRRASRSSSSATVFLPIAQSEPTVSAIRAGMRRFSPVGTSRPSRRAPQVAQLDAVAARELGQLRVVAQELVQAVLEVEAGLDALLQ